MKENLYKYRICSIDKGYTITKCFDIENAKKICTGLNNLSNYKKYEILDIKFNSID